jgi:hypothetical protein
MAEPVSPSRPAAVHDGLLVSIRSRFAALPTWVKGALKGVAILSVICVGLLLLHFVLYLLNPMLAGLDTWTEQALHAIGALFEADWLISGPVEKVIMLGLGAIMILLTLILVAILDNGSAARK